MNRLILARHAESTNNVIAHERIGGRSNHVGLTPRGERQARLLGQHLRTLKHIDTVYCSPAKRTRRTLELALSQTDLSHDITFDDGLQEVSQGEAEGGLRSVFWTPERSRQAEQEGMDFRMPGGESLRESGLRMIKSLAVISEKHPEETVLIGTHGLAIRCLVGMIKGWSKHDIVSTPTPNCSLTLLSSRDNQLHVDDFAKVVINE